MLDFSNKADECLVEQLGFSDAAKERLRKLDVVTLGELRRMPRKVLSGLEGVALPVRGELVMGAAPYKAE